MIMIMIMMLLLIMQIVINLSVATAMFIPAHFLVNQFFKLNLLQLSISTSRHPHSNKAHSPPIYFAQNKIIYKFEKSNSENSYASIDSHLSAVLLCLKVFLTENFSCIYILEEQLHRTHIIVVLIFR